MLVYTVERNGIIIGNVYRTKESAIKSRDYIENLIGKYGLHEIKVYDLPFVKRSVCFLEIYRGFDYRYDSGPIQQIYDRSGLFPCSDYAKKHSWWQQAIKEVEQNPKEFYVTNDMIASIDGGSPFSRGDCFMEYSLSIIHRKVRP